MKKFLNFCVVAWLGINVKGQAQQTTTVPAPTPYAIVSRGANARVWEQTTYEVSPSGQTISHVNNYTELGTGLCYQQNGQWMDSQEQINILPDGSASATNGQHQAFFPVDIYNGTIALTTPDGLQLQSQPLGLFYDDGSNTVMIAELTNSIGQLISPNQIIYTNAFTGVDADLLYTYRMSGFEQDIIFRQQPLDPEQFGLSSDGAQLQLLTEYFNPPTPGESVGPVSQQDGLQDTTLTFGAMQMIQGRAFLAGNATLANVLHRIPVYKSWTTVNGRTFLVEELPYQRISPQLETLPVPSTSSPISANSILDRVSSKRLLPPVRLVTATTNVLRIAKANLKPNPGMVLDYVAIDSNETNFTFQGDTTYCISNNYFLYGTTTFEGGTIIKMPNVNTSDGLITINEAGTVNCQTAPYRPAIFTSTDDNSVGQTISGSSGSPSFEYDLASLEVDPASVSVHDLRFCDTFAAIFEGYYGNTSVNITNCQFINDDIAVEAYNVGLYNVLIGDSTNTASEIISSGDGNDVQVFAEGPNLIAENVTADDGYAFIQSDYSGATLTLTNCLVTGQQLLSPAGATRSAITYDVVSLLSPSMPVYQTVGAASYYLATNSPYRTAGTTNIDLNLLLDLAEKTTWPPVLYSNTALSVNTSLSPAVQRDNAGAPDLGYHYDPLDYVVGGCDLHSNLTFTVGTAVGYFQGYGGVSLSSQPYGISLNNGANLSFNGSPTQPGYFANYSMVQEGGNGNWTTRGYMGGIVLNGSTTPYPQLSGDFTKYTVDAGNVIFRDAPAYGACGFFNCEFYNGNIGTYEIPAAYFTNCLFFRDNVEFPDQDYAVSFSFVNCTFYDGLLAMSRVSGLNGDSASFWLIKNTAFDGTAFAWADNLNGNPTNTFYDYNAYNTNNLSWQTYPFPYPPQYGTNEVVGPNDLMIGGYYWESSWFGNFYLPSDSPILAIGSTNANLLGLYHFTTQTNQTPQEDNPVDIGYHYVATQAYNNGNPPDNNGDGIPDYLEDANGNGVVDSGELGWDISHDPGLTVIITQPRNGSTLP